MDIILKTDIDKLGKAGQIKSVKDGFARNYLIPKGLAIEATPANLRFMELEKERQVKLKEKEKEKAKELAQKLNSRSYTISKKAGAEDKLFGTVTSQDIIDSIKRELPEIDIDKKRVQFDEPIKRLGVYQVPIRLHPDILTRIKVWVVKE